MRKPRWRGAFSFQAGSAEPERPGSPLRELERLRVVERCVAVGVLRGGRLSRALRALVGASAALVLRGALERDGPVRVRGGCEVEARAEGALVQKHGQRPRRGRPVKAAVRRGGALAQLRIADEAGERVAVGGGRLREVALDRPRGLDDLALLLRV